MNEEVVYSLIENSIGMAVSKLENEQQFKPYALTLSSKHETVVIEKEPNNDIELYESIFLEIKEDIANKDIEIIAIVALVDIAEHFKSEYKKAIRIHIEQKSLKDKEVGGKFIYAPFQIFKIDDEHKVELYEPFSVGFISDIFK